MGSEAEEWNAVVGRLRELRQDERWANPDTARLYQLAQRIAPSQLRRFDLRTETPEDLASGLLTAKLTQLVECQGDAFDYFVAALRNRARSWLRREASKVEPEGVEQASAADAEHERARDDLAEVWAVLSPKAREIFAADAAGESREALASRFKTSRANIDQIVRRARVELQRLGLMPTKPPRGGRG